jgi:hypothetical protein
VGRATLHLAGVTIGATHFSLAGDHRHTVTIHLNRAAR